MAETGKPKQASHPIFERLGITPERYLELKAELAKIPDVRYFGWGAQPGPSMTITGDGRPAEDDRIYLSVVVFYYSKETALKVDKVLAGIPYEITDHSYELRGPVIGS